VADIATIVLSLAKRFIETLESIDGRLADIQVHLGKVEAMATKEFADLEAQVEQTTSVEESALTLIEGIVAQLEAARNDPAAITAVTERLRSSADALSAAVAANAATDIA
jgi:hypothetical protein